ncbi:MAG: hypothetical protein ACREKM_13160, partial [Longimicrobiales bacterium]
PRLFTTRWAMSYLRGPLTRREIERLMCDAPERKAVATAAAASTGEGTGTQSAPATQPARDGQLAATSSAPLAEDETRVAPQTPRSVPVRYLDPAATWAAAIGALAGGRRLQAAIAARVQLRFDDRTSGVDHVETYECVWYPLERQVRAEDARVVDYDDRDLQTGAPAGAVYVLPDLDIADAAFYRDIETELRDHLYRNRSVDVLHNQELDLYSRVGESAEAFAERCRAAAAEGADRDAAQLRDKFETRLDRMEQRRRDADRRVEELTVDTRSRTQQELVAGAGALLSMFLGGRRGTRGLSGIASRRSTTRRTQERLETAQGKAEDLDRELAELERDLADELQTIETRWNEVATRTETRSVPLDKTDIDVDQVVLLWIPT